MSRPRQHHILPESYLAGFTDTGTKKGYLHVFDYECAKCYRAKPKEVTIERDFYRVYEPDQDQNALEHEMAQLENQIAPILAKVRKSHIFQSPKELGQVLSLLAMIYARSRRTRERLSTAVRHTTWNKLKNGQVTPEEWENLRNSELRAGIDPSVLPAFDEARQQVFNPGWHPKMPEVLKTGFIAKIQRETFELLADRIWSIAEAEPGSGGFICSDCPLAWGNKMSWDAGYQNEQLRDPKSTISFPLSSELSLITRKDRHGTYEAVKEVVA